MHIPQSLFVSRRSPAITGTPEGTHDLAAHNPVDCQNCQCFASGVALFLLPPGHFVFPSSSSSRRRRLRCCSVRSSSRGRLFPRPPFTIYNFIEQFYIEWLSSMLKIFSLKRNVCNIHIYIYFFIYFN